MGSDSEVKLAENAKNEREKKVHFDYFRLSLEIDGISGGQHGIHRFPPGKNRERHRSIYTEHPAPER